MIYFTILGAMTHGDAPRNQYWREHRTEAKQAAMRIACRVWVKEQEKKEE